MEERPTIAKILGYTEDWFLLGVIDDHLLEQQRIDWDNRLDTNPEHYRYSSFRRFLKSRRPLTPDLAAALFSLGSRDPDLAMGGTIMADIVRLPECPQSVLDAASMTGRKHLEKIVERRVR
jgi:hypothetical protein